MIKVVTMNTRTSKDAVLKMPAEVTNELRDEQLDILCCQEQYSGRNSDLALSCGLAESLSLTYSYSANRSYRTGRGGKRIETVNGLAIMAGQGTWMLSSGSFPLPAAEGEGKELAQYAVIRKDGDPVLVINLLLAKASTVVRKLQLEAIFSHPLLKEKYSALVLCGNLQSGLSDREFEECLGDSRFSLLKKVMGGLAQKRGGGWGDTVIPLQRGWSDLLLFSAREKATALVNIGGSGALFSRFQSNHTPFSSIRGVTADFEVQRIVKEERRGRYQALSLRERFHSIREKDLIFST